MTALLLKYNNKKKLGKRRNELLRYQEYIDTYLKAKEENKYLNNFDAWKDFVNPKHHISRQTLNTAINTNIKRDLKVIENALTAIEEREAAAKANQFKLAI